MRMHENDNKQIKKSSFLIFYLHFLLFILLILKISSIKRYTFIRMKDLHIHSYEGFILIDLLLFFSHSIEKVMSLKYSITNIWQLSLVFSSSNVFSWITFFSACDIGWSCCSFANCSSSSMTTGHVPQLHENPHSKPKGTLAFYKLGASLLNNGNWYL